MLQPNQQTTKDLKLIQQIKSDLSVSVLDKDEDYEIRNTKIDFLLKKISKYHNIIQSLENFSSQNEDETFNYVRFNISYKCTV